MRVSTPTVLLLATSPAVLALTVPSGSDSPTSPQITERDDKTVGQAKVCCDLGKKLCDYSMPCERETCHNIIKWKTLATDPVNSAAFDCTTKNVNAKQQKDVLKGEKDNEELSRIYGDGKA